MNHPLPICFLLLAALGRLHASAFAAETSAEPAAADASLQALAGYVARPDASVGRRLVTSGRIGKTEYAEYLLTSQTWRGVEWRHQLFVLHPSTMTRSATQGLLFIHGGAWKPEYASDERPTALPREAALFARLAEEIAAPLAVLRQVPFAPMFDLKEDALIAYTFDRYLQTGERDWPLLLPMVKSAVRAMDATQDIVRERWGASIDAFTIAGASKRGWTAWLTAALDERVVGVAPMVIDILNMQAQMALQRTTWGELSDEIRDYSAVNLPARLDTPRGQELLSIVDPFRYRERLTAPKFILLSTNDRYWPLDALELYWSQLPEPKHVLYTPNQGHSLRDAERVIGALSALHRTTSSGAGLPRASWTFEVLPETLAIRVQADRPARSVRIWSAQSESRDFREAHWAARPCRRADEGRLCEAPRSAQGYTAVFAELSFEDEGAAPFSISTTVCLVAPSSPDSTGEC